MDHDIDTRSLKGLSALARLLVLLASACLLQACMGDGEDRPGEIPEVRFNPPPPNAESIVVRHLPLPPSAPLDSEHNVIEGGCEHPTGCMDPGYHGIGEGPSYMWDNEHVLLPVLYAGAPQGSSYTGQQVVAVKTTPDAVFANGEPWKCISCGVPQGNQAGRNAAVDHPQAFHDGTRVLAGRNVISCGVHRLTDDACSPERTHIYPIVSPTTESDFFSPREPRLNADDVTLGFSQFARNASGITQFCYVGRLSFVESDTPHYQLLDVRRLYTAAQDRQAWRVDPADANRLVFNPATPSCGELRGFTSDGRQVVSLNAPAESNHVDLFTTDLATGDVQRLTRTEYVDPIKMSPDDQWFVSLDVNVSQRSHFLAAMDGLLPVNDMHTIAQVSAVRNNRDRRFFQPMLVDRWGQRGAYQGQQINGGGETANGGISDPNWNARADPAWSPDGTRIVYWQSLVTAPACGGDNPLSCPESTEPGGRRSRLMIAHLVDREPLPIPGGPVDVVPVGDWAAPFAPGEAVPSPPVLPPCTYTIEGAVSGSATITIELTESGQAVGSTSVDYVNFANDCRIFNGFEMVTSSGGSVFGGSSQWNVDIRMSGCEQGSKITYTEGGAQGPMTLLSGGSVFEARGTLVTTIGAHEYRQPANGT